MATADDYAAVRAIDATHARVEALREWSRRGEYLDDDDPEIIYFNFARSLGLRGAIAG